MNQRHARELVDEVAVAEARASGWMAAPNLGTARVLMLQQIGTVAGIWSAVRRLDAVDSEMAERIFVAGWQFAVEEHTRHMACVPAPGASVARDPGVHDGRDRC